MRAATARRAEKDAPADVRITTHLADVSNEAQMNRFRDEVVARHETDHVDLLFNNAGVGGGNSFLTGPRDAWDKTFAVCWGGVYNGMRAFADLVVASDDAYVVNTSSVNGFWASLGPGVPHTAYSAARSPGAAGTIHRSAGAFGQDCSRAHVLVGRGSGADRGGGLVDVRLHRRASRAQRTTEACARRSPGTGRAAVGVAGAERGSSAGRVAQQLRRTRLRSRRDVRVH